MYDIIFFGHFKYMQLQIVTFFSSLADTYKVLQVYDFISTSSMAVCASIIFLPK